MDKWLKSGYEGEAKDDLRQFSRKANIRTDGGGAIRVFPLMRTNLGQAVVWVAPGKEFGLEVVWAGMGGGGSQVFRRAAAGRAGWIDNGPKAVRILGVFRRGGRWCTHKGFSEKVRNAIRDPQVLAFGMVRPFQQSDGTVVVGGGSDTRKYCGTCGGTTTASRQCSPTISEFGGEEVAVGAEESGASRQPREESTEPDAGVEELMDHMGMTGSDRIVRGEPGQRGGTDGTPLSRMELRESERRLGQSLTSLEIRLDTRLQGLKNDVGGQRSWPGKGTKR